MNVAGRRHDFKRPRKTGNEFQTTWHCPIGTQGFFSRVRLDASASAAVEVNKNGLTSQMNKK